MVLLLLLHLHHHLWRWVVVRHGVSSVRIPRLSEKVQFGKRGLVAAPRGIADDRYRRDTLVCRADRALTATVTKQEVQCGGGGLFGVLMFGTRGCSRLRPRPRRPLLAQSPSKTRRPGPSTQIGRLCGVRAGRRVTLSRPEKEEG